MLIQGFTNQAPSRIVRTCLCCALLFSPITSARDVEVDQESCDWQPSGRGSSDVEDAVKEAVAMASNAAALMSNAVANPDTPESQRVSRITNHILACSPQQGSCKQVSSYFSNVAKLMPIKMLTEEALSMSTVMRRYFEIRSSTREMGLCSRPLVRDHRHAAEIRGAPMRSIVVRIWYCCVGKIGEVTETTRSFWPTTRLKIRTSRAYRASRH